MSGIARPKALKRLEDTKGRLPPRTKGSTRGQSQAIAEVEPPTTSTVLPGKERRFSTADSEVGDLSGIETPPVKPTFKPDKNPAYKAADSATGGGAVKLKQTSRNSAEGETQGDSEPQRQGGPGGDRGGGGGGGGDPPDGGGGSEPPDDSSDDDDYDDANDDEEEEDNMATQIIQLVEKNEDGERVEYNLEIDSDDKDKMNSLVSTYEAKNEEGNYFLQSARDVMAKAPMSNADYMTLKDKLTTLELLKRSQEKIVAAIGTLIATTSLEEFIKFSLLSSTRYEIVMRKGYQLLKLKNFDISSIPLNTTWADTTLDATGQIQVTTPKTSATADSTKRPRKEDLESIKFQGTKHDYQRYKESAFDLFGNSKVYTWITKFNCLKATLPDNMKGRVESYFMTEDGFSEFWTDMDQSFGQKKDTIAYWQRQMEALAPVPINNSMVSLPKLEEFYDKTKKIVRKLTEAGAEGSKWHITWNTTLSAKLPQVMAVKWRPLYNNIKDTPGTDPIMEFLRFVKKELDILRDVVTDFKLAQHTNPQKTKKKDSQKQEQNYAVSTGQPNKKQKAKDNKPKEYKSQNPPYCYLCLPQGASTDPVDKQYKHHPKDCKTPKEDAYNRVYKMKACSSCGNLQHTYSTCQKRKKCPEQGCNFEHMKSLHSAKYVSFQDFKKKNSN